MGVGGPGDNPITDILNHGLEPYPLDMCILIELLGDQAYQELQKCGVDYWPWSDNFDIERVRSILHSLYKRNGSEPQISDKSTNANLRIARRFYKLGLSNHEIRSVYWQISEKYFGIANKKVQLKGKDKDVYSKLRS